MASAVRTESITLTNVTVFREATFEIVPGINVLVGENGTGKTSVPNAIHYALGMLTYTHDNPNLTDYFGYSAIGELTRAGPGPQAHPTIRLVGDTIGVELGLTREVIKRSLRGQMSDVGPECTTASHDPCGRCAGAH